MELLTKWNLQYGHTQDFCQLWCMEMENDHKDED